MISSLTRFRVWLAARLVRGTPCVVSRREPIFSIMAGAKHLFDYAQQSGSLTDPRRVKAYRNVLLRAQFIYSAAGHILIERSFDESILEEAHTHGITPPDADAGVSAA